MRNKRRDEFSHMINSYTYIHKRYPDVIKPFSAKKEDYPESRDGDGGHERHPSALRGRVVQQP